MDRPGTPPSRSTPSRGGSSTPPSWTTSSNAGVVVLGGPLADEVRVILVVEASSETEVRAVLGRDPWSGTHLVVESVDAWTIRLDGRHRHR